MSHRPKSRKITGGSDARVRIAVDLVEVCVDVCAEGIRSSKPSINDSELVEQLRLRLASVDRH